MSADGSVHMYVLKKTMLKYNQIQCVVDLRILLCEWKMACICLDA